ncbi:MAG: hypothetical protein JWQ09_5846 [Segetibacter sp.]|nr:hypothetical protein [Segetibacter sp.]
MKDIKQELEKLVADYYQYHKDACKAVNPNKEAILTLMEQAYNLGAESKWISVEDKLPLIADHQSDSVLCIDTNDREFIGCLRAFGSSKNAKKYWHIYNRNPDWSEPFITHWQPITPPQPPIV